jgi:hypothetical protein
MSAQGVPKCRRLLMVAAMLGCGGIALAQAAKEVYVNRYEVQIREGKGSAFQAVARVRKNTPLQVVEREDRWLKVQYQGQEGYVLADSTSAQPVRGSGLGGLVAVPDTSAMSAGAAHKGLDETAAQFASHHGMDPAPVDRLIEQRRAISGEEWVAFANEGKVGPAKPQ